MKYFHQAFVALVYVTLASSAATPASPAAGAVAICGDLGILNIAPGDLPEGVAPSELRLCADHPMGRNRTLDPLEGASLAPMEEEDLDPDTTATPSAGLFEERACYDKAPYGCSRGYCWKQCGASRSGKWCWTASAMGGVLGEHVTSMKTAEQTSSRLAAVVTVGSLAHVGAAARDWVRRRRILEFCY
ncbi:hypothetical protein FVEG_12459 [Fusarium verticillioides 7600]|uniref:Uncharacterized protein n=1 Tax=Gibberella moniliformis (strain M3125 / FGSC 7600) TaxID=334819 RepID=W7MSV6_GIBM7|nr:hypothetical protein FVEG_12459 [Fusarium verticillioides 7600]EWG54186.1 hypothetical protein FVEG_12459 [Fusarium verticillioides 7600]RBQ91792.1 hypothetical protein FVER53263_12459 [Fusarium verticillioides]